MNFAWVCVVVFIIGDSHCTNNNELDNQAITQGRLIFATVLFRHGDRTPIKSYTNDPWADRNHWPVDFGHLTKLGMQQEYQLGKWLRHRYNDLLLNTDYDHNDIYVESSDFDRTLQSAGSVLAAMYPPNNEQIMKNINWQPIPVHTIPKNLDIKLHAGKSCPAHDYYLQQLYKTQEFRDIEEKYEQFYNYLSEHTGDKINDPSTAGELYDTLQVEQFFMKTLPQWTQLIFPSDDIEYLNKLSFILDSYTPDLARLKYGVLLKEILERFQNKTDSQLMPDRKIWLYSGHDTTISNLLNILGIFNDQSPPYSSALIFELSILKNMPYVQIFYKNTTESPKSPLVPLSIPKCDDAIACPLSKMFKLYEHLMPTLDRDEECKLLPNLNTNMPMNNMPMNLNMPMNTNMPMNMNMAVIPNMPVNLNMPMNNMPMNLNIPMSMNSMPLNANMPMNMNMPMSANMPMSMNRPVNPNMPMDLNIPINTPMVPPNDGIA